jgi:endoglucanase
MTIYHCLGGADQKWYNETAVTNNDYWVFNAASRKCLTVQNASTANNAAVLQFTCNSPGSNEWVQYGAG